MKDEKDFEKRVEKVIEIVWKEGSPRICTFQVNLVDVKQLISMCVLWIGSRNEM